MAFPVPEHLPRNAFSGKESFSSSESNHWDATISDISNLSWDALTPERASLWVIELTNQISATRGLIRSKINENLPDFDRQLQAALSIQSRIEDLTVTTERLTSALHDETTGLSPSLRRTFIAHEAAAQEAKDAEVLAAATTHLLTCRDEMRRLSSLVSDSQLLDAVVTSRALAALLSNAPKPLPSTHVFRELQSRARALKDTTLEQLDDAFSGAVAVSTSSSNESITILSDISLSSTNKSISFTDLCKAMDEDSIFAKLISLRKSVMSHFVPPILKRTHVVVIAENTLTLDCKPASEPIHHLSALVEFLGLRLFQILPPRQAEQAVKDLSSPCLSSVLESFQSEIPSSVGQLPRYIDFVQTGVLFEETLNALRKKYNTKDTLRTSRILVEWAISLPYHYEKKRRQVILEDARRIIVDERKLAGVSAEKRDSRTSQPLDATESAPNGSRMASGGTLVSVSQVLEGSTPPEPVGDIPDEDDGWGFDDEELGRAADGASDPANSSPGAAGETAPETSEVDPWDDDPWDDPSNTEPPSVDPEALNIAAPTIPLEKATRGVDKYAGKMTARFNSSASSFGSSEPNPAPSLSRTRRNGTPSVSKYMVSECARSLLTLCGSVIQESYELSTLGLFPIAGTAGDNSNVGSVIESAIASLCDLFRAVYPVTHASKMRASAALRVRFSNDCSYLSEGIEKILLDEPVGLRRTDVATLSVVSADLKRMGRKYLGDCLSEQKGAVSNLLNQAEGFEETGDDTRFSACESVVNSILLRVNAIAQDWKFTLAQSTYLEAIGGVVEEILASVLDDILALPDIPEKESHRLNELCQKLETLKELFVVVPGEDTVIAAHVPSWFRFAYLAELLEASLADINYLFDGGALIDFEINELVKLVQGLFADSPLRLRTIEKILRGHPGGVQSVGEGSA
ncbi:uncharacterized protein EI90DRAFT_3075846 [Cantharellus anzutake]|uniref:uncharacterized protein n=1 Tax=Cantharellus anzutake TaxID=1750568 RepID=UPI0019070E94|nr:uncharacterized protein EI90DRAFT_3075846 [Cantharellus anzutake]KAF8324318.1 hypothetical protein EI90DRAFT_3075846 [Cantharellus anzutake]